MGRRRFILVVMLALVLPIQAAAAIVTELCTVLCNHEAGAPPLHDHHDDASGTIPCGPCVACCASASIAASPKVPLPVVPNAEIASLLLPSHGSALLRALDRPPA
jgi:hypothetical protein